MHVVSGGAEMAEYKRSRERRQKHNTGENRRMVRDGEIGTGIESDRENKGTVRGRGKGR